MKRYTSVKVLCPFYIDETQQVIRCEGLLPGAVTHQAFATKSKADRQKRTCRGEYKACPHYMALCDKYK